MKGNRVKIQIEMARACLSLSDISRLAGMPVQTIKNVTSGNRSVKPATIGKVAKALNVDVTEILTEE